VKILPSSLFRMGCSKQSKIPSITRAISLTRLSNRESPPSTLSHPNSNSTTLTTTYVSTLESFMCMGGFSTLMVIWLFPQWLINLKVILLAISLVSEEPLSPFNLTDRTRPLSITSSVSFSLRITGQQSMLMDSVLIQLSILAMLAFSTRSQ
jgi:hypothetical protein